VISQEELKQDLRYDPDTGHFWWLCQHKCGSSRRLNRPAGTLDNLSGYIQISINSKYYRAHRLAWLYQTGDWPIYQVDHINGVRSDNRWCNLREATRLQNMQNQKITTRNQSGFPGVSWLNGAEKWRASIQLNNKFIYLGFYDDPLEAYFVYWLAKQKLHTFNPSIRIK